MISELKEMLSKRKTTNHLSVNGKDRVVDYCGIWPTTQAIKQMMAASLSDNVKTGGTKNDTGKPEFDRLSFEAIAHFNKVHEFGDNKYERGNWRKGLHIRRLCNAAIRHISSVLDGNLYDEESGLLHSAHAGVCLEMVTHFLIHADQYKEFIDVTGDNDE